MIVLNQKQKQTLQIFGVLVTLILAIVAIVTAIRLQLTGAESVVPSVPKSQPKAAEVIPSPGPESTCRKTWMIVQGPTLAPTLMGMPTPTGAPGPIATATPQPMVTSPLGPTAIPTVREQSLPEAGGILPTVGVAVGGLGIILLGLLLLL